MLAKTGLLIVSNPKNIGNILGLVQKHVKNTLYIQPLSALTEPFGNFHPNVFTAWPKFSQTIFGIYSQAAKHCNTLDVRVLLSGLKYNVSKIETQKPVDLVIFDKSHSQAEIDNFIKAKIQNVTNGYNVLTLDAGEFQEVTVPDEQEKVVDHAVLGGTFDRLHIAHKLLLSDAALRAKTRITIGVTDENMLKSKLLWELIEDVDVRVSKVESFLKEICPELEYDIVQISDAFGPAITDPSMELIIVSAETLRGGQKINEIRKEKGLPPLEIVSVELIDEPNASPIEEAKISSSTARIRLLGTLLKDVKPNNDIPNKPYVIGLTGGIASGKSGVATNMTNFGALMIDCDKIGHGIYKNGKPCYKLLVDHFGDQIVGPDGEIDRKVLGGIVFKNSDELKALNNMVWPSMAEEIKEIIKSTDKDVVVVEAAVLLLAGWDKFCHEVWTTIVPRDEAVSRLINRNKLTEEQAKNRIDSQPPNVEFVKAANVVFCTIWAPEYTKQQVAKAWDLLQERI